MYVYIAGPYTSDPEQNTRNTIAIANDLYDEGYVPFIPHLTHFWHSQIPRDYEDWMTYDDCWLQVCDVVLRLHGESSGADREVARAAEMDIPVVFSVAELMEKYPTEDQIETVHKRLSANIETLKTKLSIDNIRESLVPIIKQFIKLTTLCGTLTNSGRRMP